MARPVVTCGTDITYVWNQGGGAVVAALTATATNSPTGWEWTILSVPTGLEALLVGTHGDFTDGLATIQNPSLPVSTAVAAGSIVVQCVASNGPLPSDKSDPSADKQNGQQVVGILDQQGILYPGDYEYDWGKRILTPLLQSIAFRVQATSADTAPGRLSSKLSAGSGIAFSTLNPGADEQLEIAAEPADTLKSATTSIDIGSATAPVAGQVLTATGGTVATWQTLSGGIDDLHQAYLGGRAVWIRDNEPIVVDGYGNSTVELDGYLALDKTADPTPLFGTGLVYTKDVGGVAALFYMDDSGTSSRLDGYAGGGFGGYEEEFTAAGGDEDFVLVAIPATNANMLSGRNILGVYRNGQRLRYQAAPATGLEYGFTATQTINCKSLSLGDIVTVVYST